MNEIIKFYPWDETSFNLTLPPEPAIKNVPMYWRDTARFLSDSKELEFYPNNPDQIAGEATPNLGLKHCMPFFDALTSGYHYLLHCDIHVKNEGGKPKISWRSSLFPLTVRSTNEIPTPTGYYDEHLSWQMWWGIKTPPGWSVLVTPPVNRHDLPFTSTYGMVDYDKYFSPGNISFFIKEGFEGVIPMGTPIFQIIPIKRSDWKMEIDLEVQKEGRLDQEKKKNKLYGYYKKFVREDRTYD